MKMPSICQQTAACSLLALSFLMTACSDDDTSTSPVLISDLAEVHTDSEGEVARLLTDAGRVYDISHHHIQADVADTTYRVRCTYEPSTTPGQADASMPRANIYELKAVAASRPLLPKPGTTYPSDPVSLISSWVTPRYVNLHISYPTASNDAHSFGFLQDSIRTTPTGPRIAHLRLLHRRPENDADNYLVQTHLCIPTWTYAGSIDSLVLTTPTQNGGMTRPAWQL